MFHLELANALSIVGADASRYYPGHTLSQVELYFFDYVH